VNLNRRRVHDSDPEVAMSRTATAIMERLIMPDEGSLTADVARSILRLDFHPSDHARVRALSAKAGEGALTRSERAELEEYVRVGDLLALLQSKARLSLKRSDGNL
jgi:hypothetical protein